MSSFFTVFITIILDFSYYIYKVIAADNGSEMHKLLEDKIKYTSFKCLIILLYIEIIVYCILYILCHSLFSNVIGRHINLKLYKMTLIGSRINLKLYKGP